MTNTTTLHALVQDRRTFVAPAGAQPGLLTFLSQAALGYGLGLFLWLVGYMVVYFDLNNLTMVFIIPWLLITGIVIGTPIGFILWVFTRVSDRPLSPPYRATIAVLLQAIGCFALLLFFMRKMPTGKAQLGVLLIIAVTGIMIGSLAGSSLRIGRELVRTGEAKHLVARIFAVVTGLILRCNVVPAFLASVMVATLALQSYFYEKQYVEELDPRWIAAAFGHFALASIVLFARLKFEVMAVLTAIVSAPVIAGLRMFPQMPLELWYLLVGYLVTWALFLLSRWRQTDAALAVLNSELRYYLID